MINRTEQWNGMDMWSIFEQQQTWRLSYILLGGQHHSSCSTEKHSIGDCPVIGCGSIASLTCFTYCLWHWCWWLECDMVLWWVVFIRGGCGFL